MAAYSGARVEEHGMVQDTELADFTLKRGTTVVAVALLPALALVGAFALGNGMIAAMGMIFGAGYSIRDIDV